MKLVFLLMTACLSFVRGDDVCQRTLNGKNIDLDIKLPKEFSVDIEVVNPNKVVNMKMHYSSANKIIRMDNSDNMVKTVRYYDFNDDVNEILTFTYHPETPRGVCQVDDLRMLTDPFRLGGVSQDNKKISTILDPLVAFHYSGKSGFGKDEIYQEGGDKSTVRGKEVYVFSSCQKWVNPTFFTDAIVQVTHGFAEARGDNVKWPGDDTEFLLVYMHVQASGKINGEAYTNTQPYEQTYNFFNFKGGFEDFNVLETPEGVVCHGRKTTKEMPKLPPFIHYTAETIDYKDKLMFYVEEIYDYQRQYGIVKVIPSENFDNTFAGLTTVLDYIDDRAYTLDSSTGACGVTTIEKATVLSSMTIKIDGKVKMMNRNQFFKADVKDFSYLGKKKIRGMFCDTFVAHSTDYKGQTEVVVQWQFAPETSSWNDKVDDKNKAAVPVKLKMWGNETNSLPIIQNIFHVDYTPTRPDFVDLSSCFKNKQHFQMVAQVDPLLVPVIEKFDLAAFKYEVALLIAGVSGVSWTQINQIQVLLIDNDLVFEFYIGDEEHLSEITKNVTDIITKGVLLPLGKANYLLIDKVSSAFLDQRIDSDSGDDGYSEGAMAGLGIAMIVVGLVGGAGVGIAHTKLC